MTLPASLPSWPTELPLPSRKSWSRTWQDPRQRRVAEAGPPGYRRRYSSVPELVTLQIDVTRSQRAVFEQFLEVTTKHGSLPFTMADPTTDGWALLAADGTPILTETGVPVLLAKTWICLFGQAMPQEKLYGVRFKIDFNVSVMP